MKIWVDADGCPNVIKDILYRAADRTKIDVILIANHPISIPRSKFINFFQVQQGFDIADNEIVKRIESGDLVITGDIPLASEVIGKDCLALNYRGELYTSENIKARLQMRDFMETLRNSGVETGGPAALTQRDRQFFAAQLEKLLINNINPAT
jgi:uncharacterized protein YaiI (UPF0178 family)